MRKLTGDRNQCPTCSEYFNSSHAFEKHREGRIGINRRCLSSDEMRARGMVLRADGFWRGSERPDGLTETQRSDAEGDRLLAAHRVAVNLWRF